MFNVTKQERQVFDLLQEVVKNKAPNTTVRVAGGWVRDRLLGLESHDIDVTVDNMSGKNFAELCFLHMKEEGWKVRDVTTVEANVEANKHLESAILPICGIEVDFAQLRKETYDADSRNPQIQVGVTPEEDARRRDLTINALFFNLSTMEVEDFVGGEEDLRSSMARTPIDPLQTYLEDPLRILRAIRFAARFNLKVSNSMVEAARDQRVKDALVKKVSRERIWTEFAKFMAGEDMPYAVYLVHKFGLRDLLFAPTEEQLQRAQSTSHGRKWLKGFDGWDKEQNNPHHTHNVWDHTHKALSWLDAHCESPEDNLDELVRNVALLLHDVGKCDVCSQQVHPEGGWSTYHEHELSSAYAADEILKDLKAPNDVRERAVKLVRNHMRLHVLPTNAKSGLRRVLRDVGDDWPLLVQMSKADSMGKTRESLDPKYDQFDEYIQEFKDSLNGLNEVKPPLNGHQVMGLLGLKPGPQVGIVMNALKEQLLERPEMTEQEAEEFVKAIDLE